VSKPLITVVAAINVSFFYLLFLACARGSTRLGPCYEEILSSIRGQTDETDVNLLFTRTKMESISSIKGNESTKTYELYCENHQNHRDRSVKSIVRPVAPRVTCLKRNMKPLSKLNNKNVLETSLIGKQTAVEYSFYLGLV